MILLNQQIHEIMVHAMQRDSRIDMTIKMAFEKVVNVSIKVAKALVFFLDEMFKKEIRTVQEHTIKDKVD